MAFVVILLSMLLFGIISFGYLMSFKQNMTQAATEGARAGAVAASGAVSSQATSAVNQAVSTFGQTCHSGGMTCTVTYPVNCQGTSGHCVRVQVSYDYQNHPLLPTMPLLSSLMPTTINYSATAETNT